ncbi:MAG TPA: endonuclease/exonuclease/phosphatase family protein [Candidatus Omnitrophota bacterium]|jgi:endonuclease/exonuclease/phosphatase family metal-dependent hydrolase|nr:MAG: Endonuclease/Exonuclease/phosphatase family protein [Candidatus Omnitrophica bacterium ADurb.Bin314]HOE68129.1 endonuclease/exonuclease/phosphatase family protein [Candidatus Omnitrophota bacterium]HPW65075.1 endonuclease/exonuclease/phosphatase family protein [Candidatus Omnitrophota bacterium]HQB94235.1 endonuclease/exonuclease/phosphatase family protein [Candidatus Omnitrophota bacterium]
MKILTLNTWQERGPWKERWELIFRGLKDYDPDIVGFQEVFNMDWAAEIQKRSGYPFLAVSGEHSGLVFLSRFRPVEQSCLIYRTKSPNEDYLRYGFYVRVEAPSGPVPLFNTHLSWQASDHAIRMSQVLELVEFIKLKAGTRPSAVMGDFNTAPDTLPVVFLRDSQMWTDTYAAANPGEAGLTWDYRNPYAAMERDKMAERRIDFVFVTEREGAFAKIKTSKVVFDAPGGNIWPSDHFGVMTEFE